MSHPAGSNARHDDVRTRAFEDLRRFEVVMEATSTTAMVFTASST